jgi:heat shock protein HslJ
MRDLFRPAIAVLLLAPFPAVCGAADVSGDPGTLHGTSWTLSQMPGDALLPDRQVTVSFSTSQVQGSDGCNRYQAPAHVSHASFRLSGPIASTRMACPEPVMRQAEAFLAALNGARATRVQGGQLFLLDEAGNVLATLIVRGRDLAEATAPSDRPLPLGGEMRYMADAARLTECVTGRSYPMVMEDAYVEAERAYRGAVTEPGAPLYVTFDGSIVPRPRVDGDGLEPSVVVHRFVHAWPSQRCERAGASASLTNTYWRLVLLGREPVGATEGRREPHLLLRAEGDAGRYSATVGCNQLLGGYTVEGDTLAVTPAAATQMACPPPLDLLERKLGEALFRTARWQVNAQTLELFDQAGAPVALFEAVYF